MIFLQKSLPLLFLTMWLSACSMQVREPFWSANAPPPIKPALPPSLPSEPVAALTPVSWEEVDGWLLDDPLEAFTGFVKGCNSLRKKKEWQEVCSAAAAMESPSTDLARSFFEERFTPNRVRNPDGTDTGLVTGYYIPNLNGSRERSERYRYPLYAVPDDLLIIDLRSLYPDLANYRLRGRLVGRKVVPYYSRIELEEHPETLAGKELFWVDNPVELFFMQIQGSGRILLENGERVMVHYADQNGHPFRSIGKLLIERGEMTREQMSMQNIKAWAQRNPDKVTTLLAENPSYVFFEALPGNPESAPGAFGLPLLAERSLAVDSRAIPLGAPIFLSTTRPSSKEPLQRLMLALDTGGAIRGAVRADFFWGLGDKAGELAGQMKQTGRMWVLLPRVAALADRGKE